MKNPAVPGRSSGEDRFLPDYESDYSIVIRAVALSSSTKNTAGDRRGVLSIGGQSDLGLILFRRVRKPARPLFLFLASSY